MMSDYDGAIPTLSEGMLHPEASRATPSTTHWSTQRAPFRSTDLPLPTDTFTSDQMASHTVAPAVVAFTRMSASPQPLHSTEATPDNHPSSTSAQPRITAFLWQGPEIPGMVNQSAMPESAMPASAMSDAHAPELATTAGVPAMTHVMQAMPAPASVSAGGPLMTIQVRMHVHESAAQNITFAFLRRRRVRRPHRLKRAIRLLLRRERPQLLALPLGLLTTARSRYHWQLSARYMWCLSASLSICGEDPRGDAGPFNGSLKKMISGEAQLEVRLLTRLVTSLREALTHGQQARERYYLPSSTMPEAIVASMTMHLQDPRRSASTVRTPAHRS